MLGRTSPSAMLTTQATQATHATPTTPARLMSAVLAAVAFGGCSVPSIFREPVSTAPPTEVSSAEDPPPHERAPEPTGERAELVRIVDGDSVELEIAGTVVDVRLAGYNAPELYGPGSGGDGDQRTCNGESAKAALTEILGRGTLTVVGDEIDRFDRRLADLVVDGRSTTTEMIELGWGLAIGDDRQNRDRMKQAAEQRRGLWGVRCGTAATEDLVVGDTQVDPSGSDRDNLNDEWVTVVNESAAAIHLAGWVIRDDTTGHRFRLAGVLAPGGRLVVRSGAGTSTDTDLHLNETFPVWSNNGETVLLVDPSGVVAAWAFVD